MIGIICGSGFYSFLENFEELEIETPYGKPSDKIAISTVEGKEVAFIPRHGKKHIYPPHKVPYKANVYALKQLGVDKIISTTACGSLKKEISPGDFVVVDQFVDRTWGRDDTFSYIGNVRHTLMAHPYDPEMREIAIKVLEELGFRFHKKGTCVVIQGSRFSTLAESRWYSKAGFDVIGMTQYPEVALANELRIRYLNITLVTDYDAGLEDDPDIKPVSHEEVLRVFSENVEKLKKVIIEIIKRI
ncbi:methylthioadenosine phosphorylase [Caldicellulosiruptor owensensis OL]|uniref:Purine nucleoside phosphorylase n=1 Tax=Caldicellulosiruptor owensensis (strain ATCC 700167 / DSM 13100 / OL) TaxID=632518 RepID=E4Q3C2_CALOW|nr:S-methyl-5'-thioadenosine phosphorylase [Caldicellulosiruptor owensensis]ADQ05071.1 methylthioadenosine phosphorylase [Caldicellulosiruptor owensensis OL]